MGRASKRKPQRLAEKLLFNRTMLGLSQNEMIKRLGNPNGILQASISGYELGTRTPPLEILLLYAQIAGICTDILINDDLDLPEKLPSQPKHKL